MIAAYPSHPLPILLFAPVAHDYQPLRAALYGGHIGAEITTIENAAAFQQALASEWTVILVTYPVVAEALAVLHQWAPERTITILYTASEEAQAFALTDEQINDLLPLAQLQRLPLIIRREWTRQQSQPTARLIQQLESRFRAIVEGFGDAILLADGYGLVRYVNSAFGRNFGYGMSSVLGKPVALFLESSERRAFQEQLTHLGQQGEAFAVFEHLLQRADGTTADVEITGHSMLDPAAQCFVVFHVRDISARKQAEAALMESEARLRLFVEHAPAAIAMLDQEMRYLAVSHRWLADYRLGEQSIIGRSHYELFPDLPTEWLAIHQRCLQGAVEKSEADLFPRADGTVDWVRWEIHPWRNRHGAIGGLILFSEVITARKRAEEAEHEQRLLAETMRDSLAILTSSREVDAVMEQILAASARVVPSQAGAILLANNNEWRVAYSRGHDPNAQAFFKATPLLLDTQLHLQSGHGLAYYLAADTCVAPGWITFPHTAWIRSSIGVEIVLRGQSIGFLTADSATPNQYGPKDVETLQTFARYAALALENAYHVSQLEARVQERTTALTATNTQVEAILNNSPDGILLIDQDLTIQRANDALHQLFQCTPDDCFGQSLLRLIQPDDHASVVQLIQRVTTQARRQRVELRAQRKDGAGFDAELSVGLIQADGLVCILRDISERKRQERQLRYHASLQANVSDAVIVTDPAFRIQSWNKAAERIYGWRAEEAIGKTVMAVLQREFAFAEESERHIQQLQEQGWWQGEVIEHRQNGSPLHILASVTMLTDANGGIESIVMINHDITERRQAEEARRESEARYRLLAENVIDVISKYDAAGHFTFVTPSCYALTGYRPEELLGQNRSLYIHPEDLPQSAAVVVEAFNAGAPSYTVTNRLCHKAGHYLWVESSVTIVHDPRSGAIAEFIAITRDITKRKQIEAALRESEARYRLLAENAFDMVSRHNVHGDFLYVSPSTERLVGYRPDELVGRPGFTMLHPDQWVQMSELMRQASQPQPQSLMQVFQVRHKRGHIILLEISVRGIFTETGEVVEFISSARDVTEQQLAEAALRASEEKFRQVAENFDHLLFIRSPDNETMLYVNSAAERLTGIPRTQLFADPQSFAQNIHPDDLAYVRQQQSPSYLAEGRADLEYRFIRPDGQTRWFRVRTFPIKNEQGEIISQVGTIEDITERKQAELALQESEAKYRRLVETMRGGLVMFDANHKMTYVNDRFCELIDRRREELIGTSPFAHVDDANRVLVVAQLERRRQLESSTYELSIPRPDGQLIYLLAQGSPLHDKTGNYSGGFAVVTDITAQKEAEVALRQALAKEKELGELKSRFVSIASHEFRTPLATISATTETLLAYRDRLEPAQFNLRLNKILTQVEHMKEIMEDVLQLARIQAERVDFHGEEGDLSALCSDIIEEFRGRPGDKDRIICVPNQAPLRLYFDARLMRQVIGNLISNGLKYSTAEQPVLVTLRQEAETVILQVTDHGIGIPTADLKHIFEPFHRAQNVGTISGTGLGLSISKEAIKMHGGQIHIDTQLNLGTTITVTLPINAQRGNAHVKDSDH